MDEILQIKDLTKKYGDFKLDQVSSSIPNPDKPEKFFCISSKFQVQ